MLAALIIVFREVIETGLIVGIVLAVTVGIARRGRWVAAGVAVGVAGASLLAVFANTLSNALAGVGQEVFDNVVVAKPNPVPLEIDEILSGEALAECRYEEGPADFVVLASARTPTCLLSAFHTVPSASSMIQTTSWPTTSAG